MSDIKMLINGFSEKLQAYFSSLTQYEQYAWIAIAVGFIMVLISLFTW